ncbi:hypothetical protein KP509_05G018100 [Ceratopteris richardii]|nr:hypothetical protein KP509_05G018100 [Ceratopteris richardii]
MNIRASVKEKGLSICFQGIAGSPSLCGICIRKPESEVPVQYVGQLHKKTVFDTQEVPNDTKESHHSVMKTLEVLESSKTKVKERQNDRQKGKTRKCIQEYELKIEELKNEVHQAWLSVQDANRKNEKLQSELDCRSLHVDSLAQAVERQLYYLNDMKEQTERDKREWQSKMLQIAGEYQLLKADYLHLAKEAHEWVNSFPAIDSMTMKVQALVDELQDLKKKFVKQGQDLRLYYNQVLELKGNIRVFCRCRPLSAAEISMGAASIVEFDSTRDNELVICSNGAKKTFKFDRVFSPSNGQSDVFSDTAPVVVSVLDGYNVCIFAYGQTGTGKTYTMEGNVNDRGVNYRTLEELFQLTEKRKGQYAYTISVSVLEVYNEQIRDLLAQPLPPGQCARKLEIKQVTEGVHHVPGLTEATVQCIEEVWDVLQTGSRARAIGSTNANEHSSRSHCMLCVMVKGESLLTAECTRSKLWLVDLAGSERVAKTDVQGERLKEAQNINKSLSALGDVIHALATKSSHVPYRNSKLTHLLQDSLGGESKTLMFVQISPSELDAGETICSLNFASRVRGVELGIARKQLESADTVKYKQLTERLKQDGKLKDEALRKQDETLKAKEQALRALTEKVKESEKSRSTAESKVKEQQSLIEKLREDLKTNDSLKSMQAKEIEKARSVTECKLKEQHSLIEKLKEELKLNKSMEKDSTTERKLKEQQILIEKLQEELKSKDNVRPKSPAHVMEENLRQPLSNLMKEDNSQLEIASESSAMDICETAFIEVDEPSTKRATTTNVSPGKTRRISSKCNGPFPAMEKKATGRSGRFSMAGGNLKIAPSVPSHHPPLPPAAEAFTADGMDSTRSSCDSFEDSYADENVVPHLQQSIVVSVVSSPKSVGWKKGTAIAPSTVLRRSIPRKIHFKSPHLQPSYLKGSMQAASSSLPVADKESSQTAGAERILAVQNKRDRPEGVSKTRRISSMHPPWNGSTTVGSKGRAQRIPISNASKTPSSHRERAWNR